MALTTLTTKGQVTIPKKIRESLNLHAGDKIEITVTEGRGAIIRPISKKGDDLFCKLHKPSRKSVSIETMDNAIRNRIKKSLHERDRYKYSGSFPGG
jgi:AbrB family looped-hinge helix DNA binding protein